MTPAPDNFDELIAKAVARLDVAVEFKRTGVHDDWEVGWLDGMPWDTVDPVGFRLQRVRPVARPESVLIPIRHDRLRLIGVMQPEDPG